MFARINSIQINPAKLTEMKAAMPAVGAKLKAIEGIVECKACWDDSGRGTVFAVYQSQQHAEAAADTVRNIWGSLMGFLAAPPVVSSGTEVFDMLS